MRTVQVQTLDFGEGGNLTKHIAPLWATANQDALTPESWNLSSGGVQQVLAKMLAKGVPLKQYVGGKIYFGVKTGFNQAFIIDGETKDMLIAEDPNSVDIIKPLLTGRDIKRYMSPAASRYLIFTRRGIDILQYPAILRFLTQFQVQLNPRPKEYTRSDWPGRKIGPYKWYEIQDAIDYHEKFEGQKIAWPDISDGSNFILDEGQFFEATSFIIDSNEKGLLGLLNSKLTDFFLLATSSQIRGGYQRWKKIYLDPLPIPQNISSLERVAKKIIAAKQADPTADTSALEAEIDKLVYGLYGLTPEEIAIVEAATGG